MRGAEPTAARSRARPLVKSSRYDLNQGAGQNATHTSTMWQSVTSAPFDCDLELAVIDRDGPHALVFPCRRILGGWIKAETKERLDVRPTHWRQWPQKQNP